MTDFLQSHTGSQKIFHTQESNMGHLLRMEVTLKCQIDANKQSGRDVDCLDMTLLEQGPQLDRSSDASNYFTLL